MMPNARPRNAAKLSEAHVAAATRVEQRTALPGLNHVTNPLKKPTDSSQGASGGAGIGGLEGTAAEKFHAGGPGGHGLVVEEEESLAPTVVTRGACAAPQAAKATDVRSPSIRKVFAPGGIANMSSNNGQPSRRVRLDPQPGEYSEPPNTGACPR